MTARERSLIWTIIPAALLLLAFAARFMLNTLNLPPAYATPASIERAYAKQVQLLRDVAANSETPIHEISLINPATEKLFGLPEILEVEMETSPNSFFVVARKPGFDSKMSSALFPKAPSLRNAVVNRRTDTLRDGRTIKTARYDAIVKDRHNQPLRFSITFDLNLLASAAQNRQQNK